MKGGPNDPNAAFQGQGTHTLPHQHHYQKQHQQQHATLPRASVIQDINAQTQVSSRQSILVSRSERRACESKNTYNYLIDPM